MKHTVIKYITLKERRSIVSKSGLERIRIAVEIITLVALMVTVYFYYKLAWLQRQANQLTTESLQTTKEALAENKKNNQLTSQSLKTMQQALAESQRSNSIALRSMDLSHTPWLQIDVMKIFKDHAKKEVDVSSKISNKSDTPARNLMVAIFGITSGEFDHFIKSSSFRDADFFYIIAKQGEENHRTVLMPGDGEIITQNGIGGSQTGAYQNIKNGSDLIVVMVKYQDMFGKNVTAYQIFDLIQNAKAMNKQYEWIEVVPENTIE